MQRADLSHRLIVQKILAHPSVFMPSCDDGIQNKGDLASSILEDRRIITLLPDRRALFLFIPMNAITYDMHVAIVEGAARKHGQEWAIEASRWIFKNTPCEKLVSFIPSFHDLALMFAKVCGMKKEGELADSFKKQGELHSLEVLGATKKRFIELHGEV